MQYPLVRIKKGKEQSIQRNHPWVFSGAIHSISEELHEGDIVAVADINEQIIGIGHFAEGSIAVRIQSFKNESLDQSFFEKKLSIALEKRKAIGLWENPSTNIMRLIHAEGDGLSGLIIDWYNGVAVIQCHSIGMYNQLIIITKALSSVLGKSVFAIYNKSKDTVPKPYAAEINNGYVYGEAKVPHIANENGNKFYINWETGQKTGFFIDQRINRDLLGNLAKGKKILNTFCYSGGFSIYALNQGAKEVHSLDSSNKAMELVDANVTLNGTYNNHTSIEANALEYLKSNETDNDYDIIILDPPAFAKSVKNRHKAVQGYKRLNILGLNKIKPGGILFTFSCSQVVDQQLFYNTIRAAAIESGRKVSVLHQLHQPADHPINICHPESEYLKGLMLFVE